METIEGETKTPTDPAPVGLAGYCGKFITPSDPITSITSFGLAFDQLTLALYGIRGVQALIAVNVGAGGAGGIGVGPGGGIVTKSERPVLHKLTLFCSASTSH
jgi:hypothetical protein